MDWFHLTKSHGTTTKMLLVTIRSSEITVAYFTNLERMEGLVNHRDNQVKLSEKSLEVVGPKQWKNLLPQVKNANTSVFKRMSGLILVTCSVACGIRTQCPF